MANNRVVGVKKSQFNAGTSISGAATFDYVEGGQNIKITFADLLTNLGVTGTIVQGGDPLATPVLDAQGSINVIRNIENGSGVKASVSGSNGVTVEHNFSVDTAGVPIMGDPTELQPTMRSIQGTGGISASLVGESIVIDGDAEGIASQVIVTQPSDLSGVLDSTKFYFIDGVIDFTGTGLHIEVPLDGLLIRGSGGRTSRIICSDAAYTLFQSPVGGSGGLTCSDFVITVDGAGSKVYDLLDATGATVIDNMNIFWISCTSLGVLDGYSQGLEAGTARFSGTPELELAGTWTGGYFIDTSAARNLADGAYTLFKAGAGFSMESRFRTNASIDLPASASILDFSAANFPNPSTVQLIDTIITRDGVSDATDANLTPNLLPSELESAWRDNIGISNTFVGGSSSVTVETTTVISGAGAFVDLAGTFTASELEHFDAPANGQLRHLGDSPREYAFISQLVIDCSANDEVDLKIVIFRDATTLFEDGPTQRRVINNLQGGRNVAYFALGARITLDMNDYVKLQVANVSATNDITAEIDSQFTVVVR